MIRRNLIISAKKLYKHTKNGYFVKIRLNTEWSSHHSSFEATLEIKGIDSIGVLNTITRTISDDFNVNIIRLLIEAKDGVFEGKVKMKVHDVEDIQRMCVVLSHIKNIKSVTRVAD